MIKWLLWLANHRQDSIFSSRQNYYQDSCIMSSWKCSSSTMANGFRNDFHVRCLKSYSHTHTLFSDGNFSEKTEAHADLIVNRGRQRERDHGLWRILLHFDRSCTTHGLTLRELLCNIVGREWVKWSWFGSQKGREENSPSPTGEN